MPYLVLEDKTIFAGEAFGAWPGAAGGTSAQGRPPEGGQMGAVLGEVVFNTSMSGYQEMVTDLSYSGQILTLTHPQIGNYGWHDEENEAGKVFIKGIVVRELSDGQGSRHADRSLEQFCLKHGIRGLKGVDTRALTRHIRKHGTVPGVLAASVEEGLAFWEGEIPWPKEHWVYQTTSQEAYEIPGPGPLLAVLDLGAKRSILRELRKRGFRLLVYPAWTSPEELLYENPAGLVLTNGPGDPAGLPEIVATVRQLLPKLPILGICLGHQLLALAAGAETYKLPFGHRGGNQPVQDLRSGKATMTAQNHGYAVKESSLSGTGFATVLKNLNDDTVEGMEHTVYPVFSVQYHPEGAPGPEENAEIFERFLRTIAKRQA